MVEICDFSLDPNLDLGPDPSANAMCHAPKVKEENQLLGRTTQSKLPHNALLDVNQKQHKMTPTWMQICPDHASAAPRNAKVRKDLHATNKTQTTSSSSSSLGIPLYRISKTHR